MRLCYSTFLADLQRPAQMPRKHQGKKNLPLNLGEIPVSSTPTFYLCTFFFVTAAASAKW